MSDTFELKIQGVKNTNLRLSYLQISESVGNHLPTLVATYIAGDQAYNLNLDEVVLNITYANKIDLTFGATVDKIEVVKNQVTYYFTASDKSFYQESKVASFTSIKEAVDNLYKGKIEADIEDSTAIEINQPSVTDFMTLSKVLPCLKSPSCFSFNLGRLKITDLTRRNPDYVIGPKSGNYVTDKNGTEVFKNKFRILPHYTNPVQMVDSSPATHQVSWGNKTIYTKDVNLTPTENLIENAKNIANLSDQVRVNFKFYPPFMCGDIIDIHVQDMKPRIYVVLERLVMFNYTSVEVSAVLKAIE